jgi:SAM-dependent methyltransferase
MDSVRYLQADACALPSAMQDFQCRAVVDKGTLDAIASGGDGSDHSFPDPAGLATRYLQELWRVLGPGGRFLIVSTMPPHLFDLLAVAIVSSQSYSATPLKTPEGGQVFFYSLQKPPLPRETVLTEELVALLKEATDAERELKEIRAQVGSSPKVALLTSSRQRIAALSGVWQRRLSKERSRSRESSRVS